MIVFTWQNVELYSPCEGELILECVPPICLSLGGDKVCGAVRRAASSYGGWFVPRPRHSVRMTYRPSTALRLLGSLRISHNKFLRANK